MTYPAQFNVVVETIAQIETPTSEPLACDWSDPVACRDDNTQRASFAGVGLKAYAQRVNPSNNEPPETVFSDLLGDLMHLADALGLEFDSLVESGRVHYDAELRGEF